MNLMSFLLSHKNIYTRTLFAKNRQKNRGTAVPHAKKFFAFFNSVINLSPDLEFVNDSF